MALRLILQKHKCHIIVKMAEIYWLSDGRLTGPYIKHINSL